MQNSPHNLPQHQINQPCHFSIPSDVLISLSTIPLIIGLLGSKVITEVMEDIGQNSEELLRGCRLPLLNFPPHPPT